MVDLSRLAVLPNLSKTVISRKRKTTQYEWGTGNAYVTAQCLTSSRKVASLRKLIRNSNQS